MLFSIAYVFLFSNEKKKATFKLRDVSLQMFFEKGSAGLKKLNGKVGVVL